MVVGHLEAAKFLVERGANINAVDTTAGRRKPIHAAAYGGSKNVIEFLLSKGVSINDADKDRWTPLHYAARQGHLEAAKFLVERGANINDTTIDREKPIHVAAREGHKNVIEFLLSKGISVDDVATGNGRIPLHYAAQEGHLEAAKFLVERGANINAIDTTAGRRKPIHAAAYGGSKNVIEFLLSKGVSINDTDKDGWTPLHYAAWGGHLEAAKFLVEKGAGLNVKDNYSRTPLYLAISNEELNVVKYLKEKLKEERPGQRRRRHHHGDHSGHLSYKSLAIDLSNQPKIAASSSTRPTGWINDLFGWVKSSMSGLLGSKSESTPNPISQLDAQMDVNGTIMLLDVIIRKFTGKQYIPAVDQSIPLLEARGYALNITNRFEKVLNKTAIKSGISVTNLNFDPVVVQSAIIGKIINGRSSEIAKTLYSFAKEACPEFKQIDKFLDHLRSNLKEEKGTVMLQQKVEKPYKDLSQEVSRKVQLSKKPDTFLNGTSVVQGISRGIN